MTPCVNDTQQYHIYYRGTCGTYVDEGNDTNRTEYTFDELQEGINYTFTVNQTGFGRGRDLSTGPVYAMTLRAGMCGGESANLWYSKINILHNQSPQELHSRWRSHLYNRQKYSSAGQKSLVFNKMDQSLAMLCGTMQPVVLTEMSSRTSQ